MRNRSPSGRDEKIKNAIERSLQIDGWFVAPRGRTYQHDGHDLSFSVQRQQLRPKSHPSTWRFFFKKYGVSAERIKESNPPGDFAFSRNKQSLN